jgi:transcriptional regulator with XRE-family HTH domain
MYTLTTPQEIRRQIAERLRALRLSHNMSQETLAERAGVSASTVKRFESEGAASLTLIVNIAASLGRLEDLEGLFLPKRPQSVEEIDELSARPRRRRGRG